MVERVKGPESMQGAQTSDGSWAFSFCNTACFDQFETRVVAPRIFAQKSLLAIRTIMIQEGKDVEASN